MPVFSNSSLIASRSTLQPGRDIAWNLTPQHSGRSLGFTVVMKLAPWSYGAAFTWQPHDSPLSFSGYSSFGATPLKKDYTGLEKNNCTSPCPAGLNGKETCSVCNLITQKLAEIHKTVTFADNMHTKYYFSAQKLRPSTNLSAPQSTPPAQMNLSCSWIAKVHGCYSISLLGAARFAYTLCVLNTELKDSHLQCTHR